MEGLSRSSDDSSANLESYVCEAVSDYDDDEDDDDNNDYFFYYCATHDGIWPATGYMYMVDYLDDQETYEEENERAGLEEMDYLNKGDHNALFLGDRDFERLLQIEETQNLTIASVLIRRLLDRNSYCPLYVKIDAKIERDVMEKILHVKKQGNQEFAAKRYEKAIEYYDSALLEFPNEFMFVTPAEDMAEIVTILSSKAACELRIGKDIAAACSATDALMFDEQHEMSRILRAKAELAIGKLGGYDRYFIQAIEDLNVVLANEGCSSAGYNTAKALREEADVLLAKEQEKFRKKQPERDWDRHVRYIQSTCW